MRWVRAFCVSAIGLAIGLGIGLAIVLGIGLAIDLQSRREQRVEERVAPLRAALIEGNQARARVLIEEARDPEVFVPSLVELARRGEDAVLRLRAEQLLSSLDREAHAKLILDPETPLRVRTQAIAALSQRRDDHAARVLAEALQDDEPAVRAIAARVLGMTGHESALERLTAGLERERDDRVREAMIEGLAKLDQPGGLELLLEQPPSPAVHRAIAVQSNRDSVPLLLRAAEAGGSDQLLAAIYAALGASGDRRAFEVLLRGATRGRVARLQAINALGLLREARAVPMLEGAIAQADDEERRYLTTAIERIHTR